MTASADRPGDLLVRAHEARHVRQRIALLLRACDLLCARGVYTFALVQADAALSLDEKDLAARQRKGRLLARLNKFAAAREWVEDIVNGHPRDAASWSLLGEIEKAEWVSRWRRPGLDNSQMRERAAQETHLLVQAIEPFHAAISLDPMDFTAGANALTLRQLLSHLTGSDHHPVSVQHLCQAVRRAANAALKKNPANVEALAALAELSLLQGDTEEELSQFRAVFANADWVALEAIECELSLLDDLQFRPERVQPVLAALAGDMARRTPFRPRKVFLFSGHMIDRPERKSPRFPPACESAAVAAIARELDALGADASDLAICGGACGGDLLFAENCLRRGVRVELRLQFTEAEFIEDSVAFAGAEWVHRYTAVKTNPLTQVLVMPDTLGALPEGADPYSRNNLWQLYTALAHGPERVRFIVLWNREAGDGPGGTKHMVESVEKHSGQAYILDTNILCRPGNA